MKFKKKLITSLVLISFGAQTLLLSGCVGGNEKSSTAATQATKGVTVGSSVSPNGDDYNKEVWANVTTTDAYDVKSDLAILPTNKSDYDIEYVGGDNSQYVDNKLQSDIPSGASPQLTASYDAKWQKYDQNGGIYDPAHVKDNKLHYHNYPDNGGSEKYYYKVNIPEADDALYFKMVVDHQSIKTSGSAEGTQPDTDLKTVARIGTGVLTGVVALGLLGWMGKKLYSSITLGNYYNTLVRNQANKTANELTRFIKSGGGAII